MEYVHLGRSGLRVSPLCLGTMNFGPITTEADSWNIMDRAVAAGINFIDTADGYGRPIRPGYTEEIIGRWFAQGDQRRDRVVLATKVYSPMGDGPNDGRLSAKHIREACDASLRRLQTDYIDLYQMHHIDRQTPWDEVWQAIEYLYQAGKILYVGSSNFAGWHIAMAQECAAERHFLGLVCEQSKYNLLTRTAELEVLPACDTYGLGFVPWSPLQGGLLGGVLRKHASGGRRDTDGGVQQGIERHRGQLEEYEALCAEIGEDPAHVALAWLLTNPVVTAPIIGPRLPEQMDNAIRTLEITLSEETLERLDAIFPGPGGPAPEAYAW